MIIARLCGGLGNQLFIYATARRLAVKNDLPLKLDISSGYQHDMFKRQYLLGHFNIQAAIATPKESFMTRFGTIRRRIWQARSRLQKFDDKYLITEQFKAFDSRLLSLKVKHSVYLQGYWQSEKYFSDCEEILRNELKFIGKQDAEVLEIASQIDDVNSVCLHVRSYQEVPVKDGATRLDTEYYQYAIERLAGKLDDPQIFCFSDHLAWAKQCLHTIHYPMIFVTHRLRDKVGATLADFWLMSRCHHHIVANSSFSWWGAWLSTNPEKIVIAPQEDYNNKDFFPESWIRL